MIVHRCQQATPGIHESVRFWDYLDWPQPSQTSLKAMRESPLAYKAARDGERYITQTDAMTLGSALHTAFLEPETMPDHVIKWTGGRRAGEKWNEFCAEHRDKYILTPAMHETLVGMVQGLRRHPFVREWASKIEATEVSVVGDVHGLEMKGRADALTNDSLVDVKSAADLDERKILYAIKDFGYHVQGSVYRKLFNRDRFVLLFVEKTPPFDVVPVELSPGFLRVGDFLVEQWIEKIAECEASGVWPGRSDKIVTVEPPEWMVPMDMATGITFGGEELMGESDHGF